jgi:UDP-N-acetylmuramate dehydrogenase
LVIVSARFRLRKASKRVIAAKMKEYLSGGRNQADSLPSAGCVFRNPMAFAGRLIDACGLKGVSRGKAVISRSHANFILNKGGASAADIFALMKFMRDKVREKFKVNLEPEVKIWK